MGIVALCDIAEDAVILDVGGTTTDIAVFAGGAPDRPRRHRHRLLPHPGARPANALHQRGRRLGPVGAGEAVRVGPLRRGPPMALGGRVPTLVDVLNAKGLCSFGDAEASRRGVAEFARDHSIAPDALLDLALADALGRIKTAVAEFLREINDKPVYTIFELLRGRQVEAQAGLRHGRAGPGPGPAPASDPGAARGGPEDHHDVANAIGRP